VARTNRYHQYIVHTPTMDVYFSVTIYENEERCFGDGLEMARLLGSESNTHFDVRVRKVYVNNSD